MSHTFDRRDFLRLSRSGLVAAGLAPLIGCGEPPRGPSAKMNWDPVADHLPEGLPLQLPSSLLHASADNLDLSLNLIAGRIPGDIYGHVFIASPVPRGGGVHVFNGEGKIIRVDFGESTVKLKSRVLKTPCYYADEALEGSDQAFQNAGMARFSGTMGFRSQVNTSAIPFGDDRMLVAVDASRPFEIDPASLEIITPVGANTEWKSGLPDQVFSGPFAPIFTQAHPFYDEHTRELFCVNYSLHLPDVDHFTHLVRWDGEGALETFPLVLEGGEAVMIAQAAHQITCTRDYVIILDTAFLAEFEQFVSARVSRPQSPDTVLYIVKRADLVPGSEALAHRVVIPRESAHVIADYENPNGQITVHLAHLTGTDLSEWLYEDDVRMDTGEPVRSDLVGLFSAGTDINHLGVHTIDGESGQLLDSHLHMDDDFTWATLYYMHRGAMVPDRFEQIYYMSFGFSPELYTERLANLYADHPYRTISPQAMPMDGKAGALFRFDVQALEIADGYQLPKGRVMSSPQFVPRFNSSGPTDGYIVATVVSDDIMTPGSSGDEIWILDAANLSHGPIARLGHPSLNLGFTIHTTWTESANPRTSSDYMITARQDYHQLVAGLDPSLVNLFEEKIYPHFGG